MRRGAVILVLFLLFSMSLGPAAKAQNTETIIWTLELPSSRISITEALDRVWIASGTTIEIRTLSGQLLASRDLAYPITSVSLERNTWRLDTYIAAGKFIHVFYRDGEYKRFAAPDSMDVVSIQVSPWVDRVLLLLKNTKSGMFYAYIMNKEFSEIVFKQELGTEKPLIAMTYDANYLAVARGSNLILLGIPDGEHIWEKTFKGNVTALLVRDKWDIYVGISGDVPELQKLAVESGKTEFSVPLMGTPIKVSLDWRGSYIAVAQKPGRISLLSPTGEVLWDEDYSKKLGEISDVSISRSGRYIGAAFTKGTLMMRNNFVPFAKFSVEEYKAKLIPIFSTEVAGTVYAVDVDNAGNVIAVLSYYKNPKGTWPDFLSDVVILNGNGKTLGKDTFQHIFRDVAVSGNGKYVAVVGDHYLHVLDDSGDEIVSQFYNFYSGGTYRVSFSDDGTKIALGTFAGWTDESMTRMVNASVYFLRFDGKNLRELWVRGFPTPTFGTCIWALSMDRDGEKILVSLRGHDTTVILSNKGDTLWKKDGYTSYAAISPDGHDIAYASENKLFVQNIDNNVLWSMTFDEPVRVMGFSRDFLAVALVDENLLQSEIHIFSITNGTEFLKATFPGTIVDLAISRNNYLLVGFENGTVRYYRIESTEPLPSAKATLKVESFPTNARVFIDGSYKGNTPLTLSLEEGTYSIVVEKIGYSRWTSTVKLVAGESKTLNVTLEKVATDTGATLDVDSTPRGAKVYVNGEYAGLTPLNLTLEAGDYEVKIVKEGYMDWVKTVSLAVGATERINAILSVASGVLYISSEPAGAKVYINGDYRGLTPLKLTLQPGNYSVRLAKEGYRDEIRNITVRSGEKSELTVSMVKLEGAITGVPSGGTLVGGVNIYYIGLAAVLVVGFLVFFINRKFKEIEQKTTGMSVNEFSPRPASPTTFPSELSAKYTDVEFIGKGGFARVFKAKRVSDGKTVAVKVPISLDEATGKSFIKELQNWAGLKHRNIVELYDYNVLPIPYLEMEYCDGSLEGERKPMDVKKATWLVFNIAEGLKYAHSKGVIHRDIKPSNVLLKQGIPKISDWGLSKVMSSSRSSTVTGFTPLYAAPEQISGKFGTTDERTDIWQLGVLFYELVTGKLPFEASDFVELASKITTENPEPPSRHNPEAKDVEHIIMKMLAKDKEMRYSSMLELQRDLALYLGLTMSEELKKSATLGDRHRIIYYLGDLLLMSLKIGNKVDAYKYATDLTKYVAGPLREELEAIIAQIKIRMEEGIEIPPELVEKAEMIVHRIRLGYK